MKITGTSSLIMSKDISSFFTDNKDNNFLSSFGKILARTSISVRSMNLSQTLLAINNQDLKFEKGKPLIVIDSYEDVDMFAGHLKTVIIKSEKQIYENGVTLTLDKNKYKNAFEKRANIAVVDASDNVIALFFNPNIVLIPKLQSSNQSEIIPLIEKLIEVISKKHKLCSYDNPSASPKILMGLDGELELLSKGDESERRIVRADNNGYSDMNAEIGCDGAGSPMEIRPKPSTANGLIKNIKNIFNTLIDRDEKLSIIGDVHALGCHIHFGSDNKITYDDNLKKIFSYYLGRHLIDLSGKARSQYKALGSFKKQPHGFEYRTLPSVIFFSPALLKSIVSISKHLYESYIQEKEFDITETGKANGEAFLAIGISKTTTMTFFKQLTKVRNFTFKHSEFVAENYGDKKFVKPSKNKYGEHFLSNWKKRTTRKSVIASQSVEEARG